MSDGTRIVLADPEGYLLEEIANPAMKRLDVAKTYRLILASGDQDRVNWRTVNTAVVERWSMSALNWIKNWAWKNGAPSLGSDLNKHPETKGHSGMELMMMLAVGGHLDSPVKLRKFIEGFN